MVLLEYVMDTLQQILADANITEHDIQWAAWRVQKGTATQEDWALLCAAAARQIVNFQSVSIKEDYEFRSESK
jgi:hypothetical protein